MNTWELGNGDALPSCSEDGVPSRGGQGRVKGRADTCQTRLIMTRHAAILMAIPCIKPVNMKDCVVLLLSPLKRKRNQLFIIILVLVKVSLS